jgi:hypothetical protein
VDHANVKGSVEMRGCRDEEGEKTFYRFDDPWNLHSQNIQCSELQGLKGYYNPAPLLDVDLLHSFQAALYTPWYYGNNYQVSVSLDSFSYQSYYFNRPRGWENNGEQIKYTSYEASGDDSIITFRCHGQRRTHESFMKPIEWGDWTDIEDKTFRFEIVHCFYADLMSAMKAMELSYFELGAAANLATCAKHALEADVTHCVADAAGQCDLIDMNNIENAASSADLSSLLPIADFIQLARNYDDPMQYAKTGASLFLYWKYAVKPTVADVRTAIDVKKHGLQSAFSGLGVQSFRSRGSAAHSDGCVTTYGATVVVSPSANDDVLSKAGNALDKLGLSLTPSNAWDLVPWSFVIDWFVNTNDILDCISMYCHPYRFTVRSVTTFAKTVKLVNCDEGIIGSYTASYYTRSLGSLFPPLQLQGRDLWRSHKLEGAALIVGLL